MKIAFVTVAAPFTHKETYIVNELENISRLECDPFIFPLIKPTRKTTVLNKLAPFSYNDSFSRDVSIIFKQLTLKPIQISRAFFQLILIQKPKRFIYTLYIFPRVLLLIDWIEKERINHIHAYWGTTATTCAMIAARLTRTPFSFTIHKADIISDDILAYKSQKALFMRSISHWGKKLAIKLGVNQDKIKVIHLGVNIPKILHMKKKTEEKNIVCVSELARHKRVFELIEQISKFENVKLYIFGNGKEENKIKKMIKRLNIGGRIRLLGTVTPKKLFGFYQKRKFDLFILPSEIEGIPVATMEAMAYSIPVAVTKVGGSGELVNPWNGYILKQNFSNLREILNKCPEPKKIVKAYNKVKKEFSVNETSLKLLNAIKNYAEK